MCGMCIASVKQSLMNGVAVVHRISCTAIEPRHGQGGTARQSCDNSLKSLRSENGCIELRLYFGGDWKGSGSQGSSVVFRSLHFASLREAELGERKSFSLVRLTFGQALCRISK
jgi:hypothetical protein